MVRSRALKDAEPRAASPLQDVFTARDLSTAIPQGHFRSKAFRPIRKLCATWIAWLVCTGIANGEHRRLTGSRVSNAVTIGSERLAGTAREGGAALQTRTRWSSSDGGIARDLPPQVAEIAQNSTVVEQSAISRDVQPRHQVPADPESPTSSPTAKQESDQNSQPGPNAYIIGEQDTLTITVWKEREISGSVVVRPDGKITVPLVGEIRVIGMTPIELQNLLAEKLKPFVTTPQVTVAVADIRSRKVYLIGRSAKEGPFAINSSTTVLQVIAEAGGLKDFAKRKKIYILRQQGTEQLRFPFNYDDVIKGKNKDQNILLQPGDTIIVP